MQFCSYECYHILNHYRDDGESVARGMTTWLLIGIGADVVVLIIGLLLQKSYLRHIRHRHRPHWEDMSRRAPRSWRMFKGMPTTGLLICSYIGDRDYRTNETPGYLNLGRFIVVLNLLHVALLAALVIMSMLMFLQWM